MRQGEEDFASGLLAPLGPAWAAESDFENFEPVATDGSAATVSLVFGSMAVAAMLVAAFSATVRAATMRFAKKCLMFIFKGGELLTWNAGPFLGRFFSGRTDVAAGARQRHSVLQC